MSKKAYSPVNMLAGTSAPASPIVGDMYFNTSDNTLYVYNGSAWNALSAGTSVRETRNIFINGAMRVAQRGAVTPAVTTVKYVTDRWYVYTSGAALTSHSQTSTTLNGVSSMALALQGKTGVTVCSVGQRIEALNVPRGSVTFSAYVYNSTGASITPTYSFATPSASDNWASSASRGSGNLQACANNAWTRVSVTVDTSSYTNITYGLAVEINFGATLNANTKNIYVTGMQLEFGSAASVFEVKDYSEDLVACKRYYEVGKFKGYDVILSSGNNVRRVIPFTVPKRSVPTMGTVSITSVDNLSGSGSWVTGNTTTHTADHASAISSGTYPYNAIDLTWSADSEL